MVHDAMQGIRLHVRHEGIKSAQSCSEKIPDQLDPNTCVGQLLRQFPP